MTFAKKFKPCMQGTYSYRERFTYTHICVNRYECGYCIYICICVCAYVFIYTHNICQCEKNTVAFAGGLGKVFHWFSIFPFSPAI